MTSKYQYISGLGDVYKRQILDSNKIAIVFITNSTNRVVNSNF